MNELIKVRCPECGRLLFEADKVKNLIIKCYKCSKSIKVEIDDTKTEINMVTKANV